MSDGAIADALTGLKAAREEQARRVATEQARLAQLDEMIGKLSKDVDVGPGALPQRRDYEGLGIVEATKRWFREEGEDKTTPEIARAILARGVETHSKNWVPTVYATLANSGEFVRHGKGRGATWALKPRRK